MISEKLLEIKEYSGLGFKPLINYESWRVAILRFSDDQQPRNINAMQRHNETDEVFVLLQGRAILFIGDGKESVENVYAENLQPLKFYNVRRAVWHAHTLSKDAAVLIVENMDTSIANSPRAPLSEAQKEQIYIDVCKLWAVKPE